MRTLRLLVAGLATAVVAHGQLIPDDHGNTVASATALGGRSNTVAAAFEYETDVDVFSFSFLPRRSYILTLQTGTVWDVRMDFIPPDLNPLVQTSTAWKTTALTTGWTNQGAAARWTMALSPLFQFTTGTYQLAIAEAPGQDTDSDGLADSWETNYFGNLTTANGSSDFNLDGFSDLKAYLAGLGPTHSLRIQSIARSPSNDVLGWAIAPYGTYDVYAATNVMGPWTYVNREVAHASGGTLLWTNLNQVVPQKFYRLEFRY